MDFAFQDVEFQNASKELDDPQMDGWELFMESHGVTIYRMYIETSGLYQYKVYGVLDDVLPEVCARVYMDLEYRREWDTYVKELYETQADGKNLVYWQIVFPFPLLNRDCVYRRELRTIECNNKKSWVVLARSQTTPSIPEKSGVVRVHDYTQTVALTSDGKTGTKAFLHHYDDPQGSIPTWLINWGAKTGVPQFLTIMQTACRHYPEYLSKKAYS